MKIVYTHKQEEAKEICYLVEYLVKMNKFSRIESLLYDPKNKIVIQTAEEDDEEGVNPIGHSIMKLINRYSEKLVRNFVMEETTAKQEDKLLGVKIDKTHFDEYLDNLMVETPHRIDSDQYYCENMYLFTLHEPCFMCSMALVHSRVGRIYYVNDNKLDGALVSKLKINEYNLNHSYLIFKVDI